MSGITETLWLIWSGEHKGWWNPERHGYTKSRKDAGLYAFDEACHICASANAHRKDDEEPFETMVLAG